MLASLWGRRCRWQKAVWVAGGARMRAWGLHYSDDYYFAADSGSMKLIRPLQPIVFEG